MRRTLFLFFILALALKGAEAPTKPLILVSGGNANARIVLADRPDLLGLNYAGWRLDKTRSVRYAAEFLQRYLKMITGVTVPIITDVATGASRPLICVGRSRFTAFLEKERQALPPEGFILRREGNVVAIAGEIAPETDLLEYRGADRGTFFGVLEFLERVGGVRWYFPHELGAVIPKKNHLQVDNLNLVKYPFFPMRTGAVYHAETTDEFSDCLPVTRAGNSTGFHVNHTHDGWYRYAGKYPEIFALGPDGRSTAVENEEGGHKANRLCYSQPKVLELELQHIKEFYQQGTKYCNFSLEPSEKYVRFLPKDLENIYHCRCPKCQARWTEDVPNSKVSEIIFGYAANLAREIGRLYPGRRLATGAYSGFLYPPSTVEIPENLDVMVCTVMGNAKLVAPGHWKYMTDVVESWHQRLKGDRRRLFVFEYLVYPSCEAPTFYPHTMKKWFQFLKDKISGGFNNGASPQRNLMTYRFSLVNGWLWHQLLWNPEADVDQLLEGFYSDLFGPVSKPMKELFTLAINCWENAPWGEGVNPGSVSYVPERFLYRDVYSKAAVEKMKLFLEQARKEVPADSDYRRRVEYFGEAFELFFKKAASFQKAAATLPEYRASRVSAVPVIDGRLDEPEWQKAPAIRLTDWKTGEEAPVASEIKILHNGRTLFFGAQLETKSSESLVSAGKRRDDEAILSDDRLQIDFDLQKKNSYSFRLFTG